MLFAIGLVFQMPSFVSELTFDPGATQASGSIILQLANIGCFVLGAVVVLTSADRNKVLARGAIPLFFVGAAALSTLWSHNHMGTLRGTFVLLGTTLFSLAMCARLSPPACLQLIIRMMSMACLLSVIWVILYPEQAIHQATDFMQAQHAGLWRGIFSHKQGLGVVAGLTTALLLFYGSLVFKTLIFRIAAVGLAVTCLLGSGSVTGLLIAVVMTGLFHGSYWIARASPRQRRTGIRIFIALLVVMYAAFHFNLVNFIMPLLGKSADLSGRADCWPVVLQNLSNTAPFLGGGYVGGLQEDVSPDCSIDNGFIEKMVEFGYFGSSILLAVAAVPIWGSFKALLAARPEEAAIKAFPLALMLIQLFIAISETYLLSKSISWVMVIVAMYQVAMYQSAAPAAGRAGARPVRSPPTKSPPTKSPPTKSPPTKSPPTKSPPTKSPPTKSPPTKSPPILPTRFRHAGGPGPAYRPSADHENLRQ